MPDCTGRTSGLSLVELIMTLSILAILAAVILPSAQLMAKRNKEIELRRSLRLIRNAIDDYSKMQTRICDKNPAGKGCEIGKSRYPESLDILVEGYEFGDSVKSEKMIFLRRIPCDPFAENKSVPCIETWNLRATDDKECSSSSGGRKDVFDVCSKSEDMAIDGSKYKDW